MIHPLVPPKGGDGSEGDGNGADVKAADPGKDDAGGEGGNDAAVASTAGDYAAADDALFNLLNGWGNNSMENNCDSILFLMA